jgi:hypothetical protein
MMTQEDACKIFDAGKEVTIQRLMELSAEIDQLKAISPNSPTTPSGQKPPFLKEQKKKRKRKPGQKPGHKGVARPPLRPEDATRTVHHPLPSCPDCGIPLPGKPTETRVRLIEDIPVVSVEVVKHEIERKYCPNCQKIVEPPVTDALPGSTIGIRLAIYSAFLHYFIGVSMRNICRLLQVSSGHTVSIGGLFHMWNRLATLLEAEYDRIAQSIKGAKVVGGDETGWRICGKLAWLWAFATEKACVYIIDKSRGSKVVRRFLGKVFNGTLISDFWGAYNKIKTFAKQRCLYHLFTELRKVDVKTKAPEWKEWRKKLVRLLRDAIRLGKRWETLPNLKYLEMKNTLHERLAGLILSPSTHPDVIRLIKRLKRHKEELFTFLDNPQEISPYNNHLERMMRPSVLMRKISQQNRSLKSARVQAILMTIFRTYHMQGLNPFEKMLAIVQEKIASGKNSYKPNQEEKLAA